MPANAPQEELHRILDFFTEPVGEEVYLSDLERDVMNWHEAETSRRVLALLDELENEQFDSLSVASVEDKKIYSDKPEKAVLLSVIKAKCQALTEREVI